MWLCNTLRFTCASTCKVTQFTKYVVVKVVQTLVVSLNSVPILIEIPLAGLWGAARGLKFCNFRTSFRSFTNINWRCRKVLETIRECICGIANLEINGHSCAWINASCKQSLGKYVGPLPFHCFLFHKPFSYAPQKVFNCKKSYRSHVGIRYP